MTSTPPLVPPLASSSSYLPLATASTATANVSHIHPTTNSSNMGRLGGEKEKSHLDIVLDSPYLTLKGTGPDVEPTRLSGHVSLFLTEATSIKEITLQFRGKARIPVPASESIINNSSSVTTIICNHDWSFLEGSSNPDGVSLGGNTTKRNTHSRTLKAGQHFFPFSLSIAGSLPSSLSSPALGGTSIAYKLRALASRPGLAHNLSHITPVYIHRTFTPEALEYQQTLEIENTWPEKIMYSIMLPHKAWAAGDALLAVVKFSPLVKGVRVQSIISTLCETTKVTSAKGGTHASGQSKMEDTRVVASVRHEILRGRAVEVDLIGGGSGGTPATSRPGSRPGSSLGHRGVNMFAAGDSSTGPASSTTTTTQDDNEDDEDGFRNHDIITYVKLPIPSTSNFQSFSSTSPASSQPSTPGIFSHTNTPYTTSPATPISGLHSSSPFSLMPTTITPSHAVEPIVVSHRVRWSIFISNRDGHTSELRCSLPVHILDGRILEEARSCSVMSRRMMLNTTGLVSGTGAGFDSVDGDMEDELEDVNHPETDRELPSYTAHVRDRVANMFLPEASTMRVTNPWVGRVPADGESPSVDGVVDPLLRSSNASSDSLVGHFSNANPSGSTPQSRASRSGRNTPGHPIDGYHLPHTPAGQVPLEWVNSELLLSLGDDPVRRICAPSQRGSRLPSRTQSRSASPERGLVEEATASTQISDGHVHGHGVRNLSNLFKATMKPFTALTHHSHSHSHSHPGKDSHRDSPPHPPQHGGHHGFFGLSRGSTASSSSSSAIPSPPAPGTPSYTHSASDPGDSTSHFSDFHPPHAISRSASPGPVTGPELLHRALTEVPDYAIASRGFIGGVPPLSSMHGLPSYEESARHATRVAHRHGYGMHHVAFADTRSLSEGDHEDDDDVAERAVHRRSGSRSRERRETVSDSDLVGRFTRAGAGGGIMQRLQTGSEEEGEDEGIQMRIGRH